MAGLALRRHTARRLAGLQSSSNARWSRAASRRGSWRRWIRCRGLRRRRGRHGAYRRRAAVRVGLASARTGGAVVTLLSGAGDRSARCPLTHGVAPPERSRRPRRPPGVSLLGPVDGPDQGPATTTVARPQHRPGVSAAPGVRSADVVQCRRPLPTSSGARIGDELRTSYRTVKREWTVAGAEWSPSGPSQGRNPAPRCGGPSLRRGGAGYIPVLFGRALAPAVYRPGGSWRQRVGHGGRWFVPGACVHPRWIHRRPVVAAPPLDGGRRRERQSPSARGRDVDLGASPRGGSSRTRRAS